MKLYTKLLLLFVAFAIVPVALLGLLTYRSSRAAIEAQTVHHLVSTNLLKQAEITRWIEDNARSLETLASNLSLTRDIEADLATPQAGDDTHEQAHAVIRDQYLEPVISGRGFFEVLVLRGSDGVVLISTDEIQEGKRFADRPYFESGREATYVQTVYYSMTLQQPAMTVSTPIRDRTGHPLVVLAGRLDLAELSRIMAQRSGLSRSEDTYIVNKFNFFITEPRFGEGYALKKSVHSDGVRAALARGQGVGFYQNYRGIPVIGAYQWVDKWEVAILTEVDQAEAFAPIATLQRTIGGLGITVFLFAAGLGWYGARRITRPLQRLVDGAEQIGRGDLDFSGSAAGRDEIGDLSRSFERMARQLKATLVSRDALEREIGVRIEVEERLKDTLADLKRSNRELEQFAYVASHDLQEPLRMVSSYTQLLSERYADRLDEKAHKYIHYAVDGAVRMQQLIQDLLAFSRITTRGGDIQTVDSHAVLGQALADLKTVLTDAGALVTNDDLPVVGADATQLRQVFQNLISNAVKFRGKSTPRVHVSARAEDSQYIFAVQDNGIGIDPKYADKIFVIFQRLHTRSEYPGTGIGLALCLRIIQRHGGRIWFEPARGGGTTFHFTLPR